MPRQFRAIKEGVGEKASAPQSAEIELRFSSEISRTKEQSYFRSPTENHQKSINPPELQKQKTLELNKKDCPAGIGRRD